MILGAAVLLSPAAAFAATYHYVDQFGVVQSVEADSASEAFMLATNIDENSGVTLDTGTLDEGEMVAVDATVTGGGEVLGTGGADYDSYVYVDVTGTVQSVEADSAMEAFIDAAPVIHPNSGVAIDLGIVEVGEEVTDQ